MDITMDIYMDITLAQHYSIKIPASYKVLTNCTFFNDNLF